MNLQQSKLDKPLILRCGVTLPNRIAMAPLTNTQSNLDGTLHEDEFSWLTQRAGHFGLISTCAAFVSEEGHAWKGQLGISGDQHIPGLTRLAKAITSAGSVPIVQLHHAGSKATIAPRKISTVSWEEVRAASQADIDRIVEDFATAAYRAEQAGFSGVEIHGANGYIFTQFLAPRDNPRTDDYGGDVKGRAKFLRETVKAVREATSNTFMVNVRISPVDISKDRRGLTLGDSSRLAQWLAEDGVDIIYLSLRDASGPAPFEKGDLPVVKIIRDAVPSEVKIAAAGGIWTRADARKTEAAGADIIVVGKASIIHPDWPSISQSTDFSPKLPPWDPDHLRQVGVGSNFLKYLNRSPGLVVGGTAPR
ncbi:MAG: NADH:flavin oxidoreductase [Candidatus Heimdallarchaeota archaeon]